MVNRPLSQVHGTLVLVSMLSAFDKDPARMEMSGQHFGGYCFSAYSCVSFISLVSRIQIAPVDLLASIIKQ